jgi:hypothetical protein
MRKLVYMLFVYLEILPTFGVGRSIIMGFGSGRAHAAWA